MKICPNCGTEVEKMYCPDCGAKVEQENVRDIDLDVAPVETVSDAETVSEPEEAAYEVRQEIIPVNGEGQQEKVGDSGKGKFSAKSTAIVAYIGWIGLIIALILGDKENAKFHLNQALVIYLASIIISFVGSFVPLLGGLITVAGSIFILVCWGLGLYYAITQQEKEIPLLGQIKLL